MQRWRPAPAPPTGWCRSVVWGGRSVGWTCWPRRDAGEIEHTPDRTKTKKEQATADGEAARADEGAAKGPWKPAKAGGDPARTPWGPAKAALRTAKTDDEGIKMHLRPARAAARRPRPAGEGLRGPGAGCWAGAGGRAAQQRRSKGPVFVLYGEVAGGCAAGRIPPAFGWGASVSGGARQGWLMLARLRPLSCAQALNTLLTGSRGFGADAPPGSWAGWRLLAGSPLVVPRSCALRADSRLNTGSPPRRTRTRKLPCSNMRPRQKALAGPVNGTPASVRRRAGAAGPGSG